MVLVSYTGERERVTEDKVCLCTEEILKHCTVDTVVVIDRASSLREGAIT